MKKIILTENQINFIKENVEISWGGLYDCEKIYNFLYNDANIFSQKKIG